MEKDLLFQHFKAIGDIKTTISGAENLEEALRHCVHIISDVCKAERAIIWYFDKNGDQKLHAIYAKGKQTLMDETVVPGEGVVGKVFAESSPVFETEEIAKELYLPEADR